jgi:hypothetical protein
VIAPIIIAAVTRGAAQRRSTISSRCDRQALARS